jgi:acetyl-CoA synthetase
MRRVYGNERKFFDGYYTQYPGYYFTGDGARRDEDQCYWITGRIDDVIQVAGHRLGTAEIESALITDTRVVESAAIGIPDQLTGEALHVFVVLKKEEDGRGPAVESLIADLVQAVRQHVGPLATPKAVHFIPALPKTRSGKIMRRILRKAAQGEFESFGDTSTLAEPAVVEKIIEAMQVARIAMKEAMKAKKMTKPSRRAAPNK